MGRSVKKGPYVEPKLLKKVKKLLKLPLEQRDKHTIRTWSRDSMIIPEMIGMLFEVHNGKQFIAVKIIEDMVGHRLGEFAPTRKFIKHGGKLQRELERKKST
ncbi:MAG: 30S ribosomal protein S19 [Candidatus Parcubacteria bacterium]|nr:MAG: 30S ribosomal protein S19 [Candidatus Parcubacteria bacterium]